MRAEIIDSNEKVTIEEIIQFEEKYKIKFPEDYKKFLLEFNGGTTKNLFFTKYDSLPDIEISKFFSLTEVAEFQHWVKEDMESDEEEYMLSYIIFGKEKMLNIADTYNQVQLCISYNSETYGKIYWIDATHEDEFNLLSNNFDEFINNFSSQYANEFEEACETGDYVRARKVFENGIDLKLKTYYGGTILGLALKHKLFDIVKKIIEKEKLDNFLFTVKNAYSDESTIKFALENGFNINELDNFGRTILFKESRSEFIEILIDNGIDINIRDNEGKRAIDYCMPELSEYHRKAYEVLKNAENNK